MNARPAGGVAGAMLYMIVETFRDGDAPPVYRRFRDRGDSHPAAIAPQL